MQDITNAVALVTGASRGIGRGIAEALGRAGIHIAVGYVTRETEARKVVEGIEAGGGRAVAIRADVSRKDDVERLVAETGRVLGPITILVNNAAVLGSPASANRSFDDEWEWVIATNLTSAFRLIEAVLPYMRNAGWGRIVNITSVAAQTAGGAGPHYAASKAGLIGLTHSYAGRLAPSGITVNALSPAFFPTEMLTRELGVTTPERVPMRRFGTFDEAGETVVLLARNGFITGQTINVNGGYLMS